jgi:dihydroorotase-like cyclic amidohydrolase
MNKTEILNTILAIPGAQMARQNKTNFVAIPSEDGVIKVAVGTALANDTKSHKAFNLEAAVAEYKAYEAETALKAAEKANKPVKVKGPNPEAQARRDELDAKIAGLPSFTEYTATDILNALAGQVAENVLVMQIGSSAKRLVEKGVLTSEVKEKKTYYTKA